MTPFQCMAKTAVSNTDRNARLSFGCEEISFLEDITKDDLHQ